MPNFALMGIIAQTKLVYYRSKSRIRRNYGKELRLTIFALQFSSHCPHGTSFCSVVPLNIRYILILGPDLNLVVRFR